MVHRVFGSGNRRRTAERYHQGKNPQQDKQARLAQRETLQGKPEHLRQKHEPRPPDTRPTDQKNYETAGRLYAGDRKRDDETRKRPPTSAQT